MMFIVQKDNKHQVGTNRNEQKILNAQKVKNLCKRNYKRLLYISFGGLNKFAF